MNCKFCSIKLNSENARLRKESKYGMRPECKSCYNEQTRPKARLNPRIDHYLKIVPKPCENCDQLCRSQLKRSFCSDICRFFSYVSTDNDNDCWTWRENKRDKDGYGKFIVKTKWLRAHRFSYEYYKESIPKNLYVCHSCDNPPCVNPSHLWIGDNRENQLDRYNKKYLAKKDQEFISI